MFAFVPVVPQMPSPRAEALGQRLAETIEQFRQQNPDLSGLDVRQATRIAVSRSGGAGARPRVLLALLAVLAAAGLAFALVPDRSHAGGDNWTIVMPLVAIAAAAAVVAALRRR